MKQQTPFCSSNKRIFLNVDALCFHLKRRKLTFSICYRNWKHWFTYAVRIMLYYAAWVTICTIFTPLIFYVPVSFILSTSQFYPLKYFRLKLIQRPLRCFNFLREISTLPLHVSTQRSLEEDVLALRRNGITYRSRALAQFRLDAKT